MMSVVDQSRVVFFSALLIITRALPVNAIHNQNQNQNNPVQSVPLYPHTRNQTARIISDVARVSYLNSRLRSALFEVDPDDVQLAPLSYMAGGYVAPVWVGQPGANLDFIVDTGANKIWVKCYPCSQGSGPVFHPSTSSSFNVLECSSPRCNWGKYGITCQSRGGRCGFKASYGDGSAASGDFVTETLQFGSSRPLNNVAIGCAYEVSGNANFFDGNLGLGPGSNSLNSQLKATSFSYCLTTKESKSRTLDFYSVAPSDSVTVPMVRNPKVDLYYYVELSGITVGEIRIPVPPEVYRIGDSGAGGVVVDSGATQTYLNADVYKIFLEAFHNHTQLASSPAASLGRLVMNGCYYILDFSKFQGPAISFQFSNGQSLALGIDNYMIGLGNHLYCLAVQPANGLVSVIGNVAQDGMRVTYDLGKGQISFSPKKC